MGGILAYLDIRCHATPGPGVRLPEWLYLEKLPGLQGDSSAATNVKITHNLLQTLPYSFCTMASLLLHRQTCFCLYLWAIDARYPQVFFKLIARKL